MKCVQNYLAIKFLYERQYSNCSEGIRNLPVFVIARSSRRGNPDRNLQIGAKRTGLLRCGSQWRMLWI